jgi:hypothetical protein
MGTLKGRHVGTPEFALSGNAVKDLYLQNTGYVKGIGE